MKTIAPEIATTTIIHAPAERNLRILHSHRIYKLQEASSSMAERFHHCRPSVPTTGTLSDKISSEVEDYEEIIFTRATVGEFLQWPLHDRTSSLSFHEDGSFRGSKRKSHTVKTVPSNSPQAMPTTRKKRSTRIKERQISSKLQDSTRAKLKDVVPDQSVKQRGKLSPRNDATP